MGMAVCQSGKGEYYADRKDHGIPILVPVRERSPRKESVGGSVQFS